MESTLINLSNLNRFLSNIKSLLAGKQDITPFTIDTTNDSSSINIHPDSVVVLNTAQTFSSKTFNLIAPDGITERTWTLRFQLNSTSPTITFNPPSGYALKWANSEAPEFTGGGKAYEITFKYIPGVNLILGVYGEF